VHWNRCDAANLADASEGATEDEFTRRSLGLMYGALADGNQALHRFCASLQFGSHTRIGGTVSLQRQLSPGMRSVFVVGCAVNWSTQHS
jgi:hypothetical protein